MRGLRPRWGGWSLALLVACGSPAGPPAASIAAPTARLPDSPVPVADASPEATAPSELDLVVYSARKEELMMPLVDAFKRRTGVNVTLKTGAPGELTLLIEEEKSSPRGDVYFTTDAATAEMLRQKGLLEPYRSPRAEKVPPEFRAADGSWTGVIGRSRNLMLNSNLLKLDQAPTSVFELAEARWKDKVAMASIREGGVRLWLAWLLLEKGEEFTKQYVASLRANGLKVLANHTEVSNAVARGELPVGLINHYYYVPKKREGLPVELVYPDQGPNQVGTLVTPLAVAIVKGARHPSAARAFVDFALSPEGQAPLTAQEQEFPLVAGNDLGAAAVSGVLAIDQIKRPSLDFVELANAEKRAVSLFTPALAGP